MATIRVLSAEGEETIWPHAAAAEQAIALKDWIDDTGGGGVFKGTKDAGVSASALRQCWRESLRRLGGFGVLGRRRLQLAHCACSTLVLSVLA